MPVNTLVSKQKKKIVESIDVCTHSKIDVKFSIEKIRFTFPYYLCKTYTSTLRRDVILEEDIPVIFVKTGVILRIYNPQMVLFFFFGTPLKWGSSSLCPRDIN